MTVLGKTFASELAAAGLAGLPISWGADGDIQGRENLTVEQDAALDAVIAAHDPAIGLAEDMVTAIRDHAETLIRDGVTLEGSPFRGDQTSLSRLECSAKMLRDGLIPEAKFMTAAGVPYTVTNPDILDNLWAAIVQYGAQVLAASTDLQLAPPASAEDVPGNAAWPAVPSLTIAALTPAP